MKALRWLVIALAAYVGVVVAFESLVTFMGKRQADRGLAPDERWLVITTTDASGSHDTVVAGMEDGGQLYVAANHWPRGWYHRALANPDVEITRAGTRSAWQATPVTDAESSRLTREFGLPLAIRLLTGFPPRSFLVLTPR